MENVSSRGQTTSIARVWHVRTSKVAQLKGHTAPVSAVAVAPDGVRIVTGSDDHTVRLWHATTLALIGQLKGHAGAVTNVTVMPNGARLITAATDNTVRLWDAKTFAEIGQLKGHAAPVRSVTVTPDSARIITGSADKTARVWDAGTFEEIAVLRGHTNIVTSVSVTPDGTRIVTGSGDAKVRVWDAKTFTELAVLAQPTSVTSVGVTPDGTRFVVGSSDRTVQVWDARTFTQVAVIKDDAGPISSAAIASDGTWIAIGSSDRTARLWELFPFGQALVAEAQQIAPRCLTEKQRQNYHLPPTPPRWCETLEMANAAAAVAGQRHRANQHRDAITGLEQVISQYPATAARLRQTLTDSYNTVAWKALLDVALRGKSKEALRNAIADANKAVELMPNESSILDTRGQILLALNMLDEALADLDKAIALGAEHVCTYYAHARVHELKGNRFTAIAGYRKALSLDAGNDDYNKHTQTEARARTPRPRRAYRKRGRAQVGSGPLLRLPSAHRPPPSTRNPYNPSARKSLSSTSARGKKATCFADPN